MPPRPPPCCKAVQRQLLTPSDSIWMSDEVLSIAFQCFYSISRTSRRYGSSVPGPMESRRRLGKRRMTHVSERIPSSAHNLGPIWGSFWEPDRTQWQWQAPTPRSSNHDRSATALPSWLLEWDTTPQEQTAESSDFEGMDSRPAGQLAGVEDDIRRFRESLKETTGKNKITTLIGQFSGQFKKSLTLGLVSMETLEHVLQYVSVDIREAFPNEKLTTYACLSLYAAVWEGIEASKVLGPTDIDIGVLNQLVSWVATLPVSKGRDALAHRILHSVSEIQLGEIDACVLNRLVSFLAELPVTQGRQALAHRILHSASDPQLRKMKQGITSLVQKWSESWLSAQEPRECTEEIRFAESLVAKAVERGVNAQKLAMALEQGPNYDNGLSVAEEAIADARAAISKAIDATVKADDIISPLRASAKALALALGKLPDDLVGSLLASCTKRIMTVCENLNPSWSFRHHWLCVVAQMPNVGDHQLVRTWKILDSRHGFRGNECAEVVLSHWISQNKVEKSASVTNMFMSSSQEWFAENSSSFARLLLALDRHREMSFTRTGDLFNLLHKLGRHWEVSNVLLRMEELNMKIPTTMLGAAVEKMSAHSTKRALDMWYLPFEMKLGYPLRPEFIPRFVTSLIDDPAIPSRAIWKLLNIPIYNPKRNHRHLVHRPELAKPLPQEMIDLMHKMAAAFSRSEARNIRVAYRNICQCLQHLRIHHAPISPELTRALNHAGTTRSIISGMLVSTEKLRHTLKLIAEIEGEEVAKEVDETVYKWRQFVKGHRIQLRRNANPLRVDAIH